jgi:serine/threonine protein phosphatase PrpC
VAKVTSGITWNAWGDTDPGKLRENNEDRLYCDPERGIFAVVDGMGGEAAGEVAAETALGAIRKRLGQETGTVARRIREAIAAANNEVFRLAASKSDWHGMACVLTVAVIEDGILHVGHVGDSRLYLIRNHGIRKVTPDHSPVGRREDAGELSELEAMRHPRRNEVFRDVGSQRRKPDDEGFIEYLQLPFERDCALVMCSDGLSDMITSAEILRIVELHAGNLRETVRQLISHANSAGGKDNISVVVVAGDDFASAVRSPRDAAPEVNAGPRTESASKRRSRLSRWIFGKWQVFVYGLLIGAAALMLLYERRKALEEQAQGNGHETVLGAQTLSVNPGGTDLQTISQALDKARPGDRVSIVPGEYHEPIRLKSGVIVAAEVPGEVVIHVSNPLSLEDAAVVAEGIRGARLSGVVIKAGPDKAFPLGIRILDSDVDISNVEVSGASQAGVWIGGSSHAKLAASYIYGNAGPGIVTAGTARPRIVGNTVQGNGFGGPRAAPGILVTDNSEPAVLRNVIAGNAAEGIRLREARLKERMIGNFFNLAGKPNKAGAIGVERSGR